MISQRPSSGSLPECLLFLAAQAPVLFVRGLALRLPRLTPHVFALPLPSHRVVILTRISKGTAANCITTENPISAGSEMS